MLLAEGFEAFPVLGLHLPGGLDFDGHLGVTDDDIHLFLVVGVPVGDGVPLVVVAFKKSPPDVNGRRKLL